ncbi:MAG: trigger factor [Deltaproteobacteria bacterium 13_1_40CM_68_24]|nr:MAG: trigger factor [Deltaproteobacteria bacterium 13_1_40CM_68_24]
MVQSRVEDLSPVVKKVSVEVTPDRVKDALDRAFTSVSRTVKLKGYRQGHVPRRLVERYFGDDVKKDVAQKLVTGSIQEALAEHQLDPVAPPRVENGSVEPGQPFKYTATVEVRPRVEPKDYEGLTVPKIEPVVTDAEVDEQIEELRSGQAMFVPVEGRDVAEAGDFVSADYEGFVDGAPLRGAKREGVLLEVAEGSFLENKAEGLLGSRVGETRELAASFPSDYTVEDLRGKEGRFQVVVKGLKRREVPALDDAFVQDLGGEQKTVPELRAKIRGDMEQRKKERAQSDQREAVLTALVEKNPLEAPPALVERNVDAMLQGMLEGFMRRGIDPRQLGLNLDRMRDELRQRALLEVKGYLLLEAIAEKEKIEATEEDLAKHFDKMAADMKQPAEKIRAAFRRQDTLDSLKARLRQDKALAFLLSKANFQ